MGRRYTYVAPFSTEIIMSHYFKKIFITFITVTAFLILFPVCSNAVSIADIYQGDELCYSPHDIVSGVTVTNNGEYATYTAVNGDPYIYLRATTASVSDKYVLIKYRTSAALSGQLYFKSAEPSVLINWNGDGEWNTIIVDATAAGVNWSNKSIFRFDPLHSNSATVSGNSIDIEYIAFFASESEALRYAQDRDAESNDSENIFIFTKYGSGYGVSGCTTSDYAVAVPEMHDGLPVTHIYSNSFVSASRLKYLYIPPTVTSIQAGAFDSTANFKLVGISGSTAEAYAKSVGMDFIAVTTPSDFVIELENKTAKIVKYTGTSSNVVLPLFYNGYKITDIGNGAFEGNTKIRSVTVVYCIEWIGDHAFASTSITSASLGESVKYIGKSAFAECTSLSSLSMPSVRSIGDFAFFNCRSLSGISLPASIETIGLRAFAKTALKTVTLPANLYAVNRYAFLNCSSLSAIYVDASNSKFSSENGILYDSSKKNVYICPEGKTGTVTLNSKTETVGKGAFINCDRLSTVNLSNVSTINSMAFYDCDALSTVDVQKTVFIVNDYAFTECDNILIKCPISTAIQYHCKEFSIPFEIVYADFILGDANGDGKINGKDMVRVRSYILYPNTAIIKDAADIDGDGDIDSTDLKKLRDMF